MKRLIPFFLATVALTASATKPQADFIHPGMLHTAEDFTRIRAQIADGHAQVTAGYKKLLSAEYAQSTVVTYPVDTIIRGGSDNYINAARGAAMAYQNALRWQIDGSEAHAAHAVDILNKWVATTKEVTGDTNAALAFGLYAYEFCNAAELLRDYSGWAQEDFEAFKNWMLELWYPKCLEFLCVRWDTWENATYLHSVGHETEGRRPGHYWSNWGLCNALSVMCIGILCDDVEIYNRGMSFYRFDQAGTFSEPRGDEIRNDGCNEYIGNLVPVTVADSRGPLGKLGQMQEAGRDQGHCLLSVGLATDLCQVAWNQGDDLFSLMDNRLAAGIEHTAAYNFGLVDDLPFTTYVYATCRTAWHNADYQTAISSDGRGGIRNYWGRVIGHYEGVKGIKMPYSEMALEAMGIDGGGTGSVSGPYDHLGYTVLTCTREAVTQAPPALTPYVTFNGETLQQSALGALSNTWQVREECIDAGCKVTLSVTADTEGGAWLWSTGETTSSITVTPYHSHIYRVTYTSPSGTSATQMFSIAVKDDTTSVPDKAVAEEEVDYNTVVWYDLSGRRVASPSKGVYIGRTTSGKTLKLIM